MTSCGTCYSYVQQIDHTYTSGGRYNVTLSACTEEVVKGESCPQKQLGKTTVRVANPDPILFTPSDTVQEISLTKGQIAVGGGVTMELVYVGTDSALLHMKPEGYDSSYMNLKLDVGQGIGGISISLSAIDDGVATFRITTAQKG